MHMSIECSDDDVCTEDSCEPATGCVHEYRSWPYRDVYPLPRGDGAVEGFDILCVLDAANSSNAFGCLDVLPTGLMAGDIYPCDGGDGAVEGSDILAVLDAAAGGANWCDDPCP